MPKKRTYHRRTTKKTHNKRPDSVTMKSLKLHKETRPFLTFQATEQTFYWSLILFVVSMVVITTLIAQSNIMDTINSTVLRLVF